jgi:hypothetical protein
MLSAIFLASGLGAGDGKKDDKEKPNPYRTAKVGDFAIYKTFSMNEGMEIPLGAEKKTVTAKDEKSVTLKITRESKERELKIDLTKPYEIPVSELLIVVRQGKFAKAGEGTEKIKVAGKEYNANWIAGKFTGKFPTGEETTSEIKVWFSKDAALDGLLRMKAGLGDGSLTMELSESGSAK